MRLTTAPDCASGCHALDLLAAQAKQATSLHALVVATDDERIAEACRAAGAQVVMTSEGCPNGEASTNWAQTVVS